MPFGSGLNTLANFDWSEFRRMKWEECFIGDGDCLTPKGFTFMRMQPAEGISIDFYNLHADAGQEDGDQKARRDNIQEVADYIEENSQGRAVLVFGDTNTLYSRKETDNIRVLGTQSGLVDAWVERVYGELSSLFVLHCTRAFDRWMAMHHERLLFNDIDDG